MRRKETRHLFVRNRRWMCSFYFSLSLHSILNLEILNSSYKTIADYIYHIYLCLPAQESFYKQQQLCKNNINVRLTLSYALLNYITKISPCTFHYFSDSGPRMTDPYMEGKKKNLKQKRECSLQQSQKFNSIKMNIKKWIYEKL